MLEHAGQRQRICDERGGQRDIEPGPRIGEILYERDRRHRRTEQEGDEDAGGEQRGKQAQEARHGIVDQGRLGEHAAGDEKTRDDEEHVDRDAREFERLEIDQRARRPLGRDQREAVIQDHGRGREESDQIEIVVSALQQSGDRVRHRSIPCPRWVTKRGPGRRSRFPPLQGPYRGQCLSDSAGYAQR